MRISESNVNSGGCDQMGSGGHGEGDLLDHVYDGDL
jgi:hypothetical protein